MGYEFDLVFARKFAQWREHMRAAFGDSANCTRKAFVNSLLSAFVIATVRQSVKEYKL